MSEKKYSPQEAALAVLAKVKEICSATLAKSEISPTQPMSGSPQEKEIPLKKKGSYRLAEFMGRRAHKKEQKAKEQAQQITQPIVAKKAI